MNAPAAFIHPCQPIVAKPTDLHPSLPKGAAKLSDYYRSENTKSAYCLRAKTFLPIQYAPPIRTSAGKPSPAIGPGAATASADGGEMFQSGL
jgi:hypothetical protein